MYRYALKVRFIPRVLGSTLQGKTAFDERLARVFELVQVGFAELCAGSKRSYCVAPPGGDRTLWIFLGLQSNVETRPEWNGSAVGWPTKLA